MLNLANRFGGFWRHFIDEGLDGGHEVRVQRGHLVVVVLLLSRFREGLPGQVVDVPGVLHLYVGEAQLHGAVRLG